MDYVYPELKHLTAGNGDNCFSVYTGTTAFAWLDEKIPKYPKVRFCAVITDQDVYNNHYALLEDLLKYCRIQTRVLVLPNGWEYIDTVSIMNILDFLSDVSCLHDDVVIGFGGRNICKLAAVAASLYLRGVRYIQIPTTLSAIADPLLGGTNDFRVSEKAFIKGAIPDPVLIYSDFQFFRTLNEDHISRGMAEIIKFALLNSNVYNALKRDKIDEYIVESIRTKIDLVYNDTSEDRYERLDFHRILSDAVRFSRKKELAYSEAVYYAVNIMVRASVKNGFAEDEHFLEEFLYLIKRNIDFSYNPPAYNKIIHNTLFEDFLTAEGKLELYIPVAFGKLNKTVMTIDEYKKFIKSGLSD